MTGLRVELVSEHASPLVTVGPADAGGQNVHVAALATHLAALGCTVSVVTRPTRHHCHGAWRWRPASRSNT